MLNTIYRFKLLIFTILITSSCFTVSEQEQLLSNTEKIRTGHPHCFEDITGSRSGKALDEAGFTLVSWNIYKGNKEGWVQDLLLLSDSSDLILLQEAYLTQALSQFLETSGHDWDMISAFRYQGIHAGVMTMGHTPPQSSCAQRVYEPLALLPKSSLVTYYPIKNTQQTLLVANIHAINFTLGIGRFTQQLMEIKALLAQHKGPIVFAGDFNTWSDRREAVLDQIIGDEKLGLLKVEFVSTVEHLVWGHRLDHIFFRGLKVISAEIIPVESSDHYPLKVHFEFVSNQEIKPIVGVGAGD